MVDGEKDRAARRKIMDIKFSFRRKKKIRLDASEGSDCNTDAANDIDHSSSAMLEGQRYSTPRSGREEQPRSIFSRLFPFRRKKGKAQSNCTSSHVPQQTFGNTDRSCADESNRVSSQEEGIIHKDGAFSQSAYRKSTSVSSPNLVYLKRLSIDSLRETEPLDIHSKHGSFRRSRASLVFPASEVQNSFRKFDCFEQSSSNRNFFQVSNLGLTENNDNIDHLSKSFPIKRDEVSRRYMPIKENTRIVENFLRTNDGRSPHPGRRNLSRLQTISSPNVFEKSSEFSLTVNGDCFTTVHDFHDLDNQLHEVFDDASNHAHDNLERFDSREMTKTSSFVVIKDKKNSKPENRKLERFVSCPYMLEMDHSEPGVASSAPFNDQCTIPYSSHRRPFSVHESALSLDFLEDNQRRRSHIPNDKDNNELDSDPDSAPEEQLSLPSKDLPLAFGEALWDYSGDKRSQLSFRAGDTVAVYFMSKKYWWWGTASDSKGWFPASIVRLRIDQESSVLEPKTNHNTVSVLGIQTTLRNKGEVRSKCVNELLTTEKDYVKTLKDVTEGYLKQSRKRPDLFNQHDVSIVFSNIELILKLHEEFLEKLRKQIDKKDLFKTEVGELFISHKDDFHLYSEYCNNHPNATTRLHELQREKRYKLFFESCRLLQQMIPLSIDAFLLTPVQKICKYPLQLNELLRHTPLEHPDYGHLQLAVHEMKEVASLINERKKKVEDLNSIAEWQLDIDAWQGNDILEVSCEKIHAGLVESLFGGRKESIYLALFDHLLVLCKVDSSRKQRQLVYFSRFNLDSARVDVVGDVPGHKPSNVIRVTDVVNNNNTFWFNLRSKDELDSWRNAFKRERSIVGLSAQSGPAVTLSIRRAAMASARSKKNMETAKGHRRRKSLTDPFQDFGASALRRSLRLRRTQSLRDRKFFN